MASFTQITFVLVLNWNNFLEQLEEFKKVFLEF